MILWLQTLTMEEIFILTGASVLLIGIAAGLLLAWIETKIERKSKNESLAVKP